MKYAIVLVPGPDNWGAFSPNVPGCVSTGADAQETLANYLEALEFHLEGLQEDSDPIPAEYNGADAESDGDPDYVRFRWAPVDTTPIDNRVNPPPPALSTEKGAEV